VPSTSHHSSLRDRLATRRNLTIATATAVAIPAAYLAHSQFAVDEANFLLLLAVAVGVPTAFDAYGPEFERAGATLLATVATCLAAAGTFVGIYLLGTQTLSLSPFLAAVGAFLVAHLGPLAAFAALRHQ
jgi:hypothetical protein